MKLSLYNHLFTVDGRSFLYNLISTAIVELDDSVLSAIQKASVETLDDSTLSELCRMGFVVPSEADEQLAYRYFYDSQRYGRGAACLHFSFIPTYSCNLACPYCLQGNAKTAKKISKENIGAVLTFIESSVNNSLSYANSQKLFISLYGGEPMMAKDELRIFCEGVDGIAKKHGLNAEMDMTTNLTLLDGDVLDLIRTYKIHVQASIDGSKVRHDKRRIKIDGSGTYDIIVANLKKLVDVGLRSKVTIRLNIDAESVEEAERTFMDMKQYSDDVYFAFLAPYKGINDGYESKCVTPDCYSQYAVKQFNRILHKYGRRITPPFGKKSPCALNSENKFWIDCNLDVYKCELLVKMPECRVGYLSQDGMFHENTQMYKQMTCSPFNHEKCRSCKLLPLCGGGCPATAYINTGIRNGDVSSCQCSFTVPDLTEYLVDYVKRAMIKQRGSKRWKA